MTDSELLRQAPHSATAQEMAAWLDRACAGDMALRARLEALLAAQEAATEHPGAARDAAALAEKPGDTIGHYKLLDHIGEGGFGVVYLAEQLEPVRRRVALKIIKAGMDTRQVVARFEQERQALAMMDHPNISKVFDAGCTDTGRPYFVMELVKGVPVTRFCDEQKLGTRERLGLFADICSAINHAHQKGIIHRDIKPSNVMVTLQGDKPVVKIIDFGIAKATQAPLTEKTIFTRFEQFIGTPAYMSPEQAALSGLDIDTRSDIYALGILLYELLTGSPPFDPKTLLAAGYEEMRRIIREVDPPKPSARLSTAAGELRTTIARARQIQPERIARLVEPDLDWIVMKAIEKDRKRRYETANAFALDIQHFLADEPVSASPPGAGYLLKKFARRHRGALRVAAAIAVLLVAATVVSTMMAIRATNAEKEVKKQLEATAVAREDAEEIVRVLTDMLESPDPDRKDIGITVAQSLDRAALIAETTLADRPARLMRVKAALARAYGALGDGKKALPMQQAVVTWLSRELGEDHPDTVRATIALAGTSSYPESAALLRKALAWHMQHLPADNRDTSMLMSETGRVLWFSGEKKEKEEGLKFLEEALRRFRVHPGVKDAHSLPLIHWLAVAYTAMGREDEARKLDDEHLALSMEHLGPKHPETLRARSAAASHITDAAGRGEALDGIITDCTEVYGSEHPYTLAMLAKKAAALNDAGDTDGARDLYEDVLERMEKKHQGHNTDTLWVMGSLASVTEAGGDPEAALAIREEAARISGEFLGATHPDTLGARSRLAASYDKAKRFDDAVRVREEILPLLEARDLAHSDTTSVRYQLLKSYEKAKRLEDIVRIRRGMVAASAAKRGADSIATVQLRHSLAHELNVSGHGEDGLRYSEETLGLVRKLPPTPDNAMLLRYSLFCTAWHYTQAKRETDTARLNAENSALHPKLAPVHSVPVPEDAVWKWFHPNDGKDPEKSAPGFHGKFPQPGFDDNTWTSAAMTGDGFGYGKGFKGADIGTPPSPHRLTAYFRHRFTTTAPLTRLELRARRDDGLMIYLDGKRIALDNMPDAPDAWSLSALQGVNELEQEVTMTWPVPGTLPAGEHVLAISVHNFGGDSSDLRLGHVTLVELAPVQ